MNEEKLESQEVSEERTEQEVEAQAEEVEQTTEETKVEGEAGEETEAPAESEEDSFKDKFYYLAAEMENMKRRFDREKDSIVKYGTEKILNGLLPVLDNLDRTLAAVEGEEDEKVKNILVGVKMVRDQFFETLKQSGLEEVESIGKIFDPNFHEAMSQQAAEGKEDMEIIAEFEKGYILNGRLLRAAKVVVAKN
jgi:molecular chaperone GrpE